MYTKSNMQFHWLICNLKIFLLPPPHPHPPFPIISQAFDVLPSSVSRAFDFKNCCGGWEFDTKALEGAEFDWSYMTVIVEPNTNKEKM